MKFKYFFSKNTPQITILLIIGAFVVVLLQNQLFKINIKLFSLSSGDRYVNKLALWRYYASNDLWDQALNLESAIDPIDIVNQKNSNYPPIIKQEINKLIFKNDKSVDDFIEIAKFYSKLNRPDETKYYLLEAKKNDPIRDDIQSLLNSLNSN
ncbi:hypothetical protein KKC08_01990 [Patescibacteria group bacterium]|nr:hypothetical protein [Patescibacteria group bacterium]MBU4210612.1 hypothetical protein [Patescibacteria group bacterium]MBU4396910.1 hypothetical protein [Patescibacteria group bacterium]MBU4578326.1 hypothetical protein [Patescibacteria group bacterium]MCG2702600.1 hypothetical protein [Candidatus Parcubacteria bacterium]